MAKAAYQIPVSLDRSVLDHEIRIVGKGWQLPASPIKQIGFFIGGILVVLFLTMRTFISRADPSIIAAFVVWAFVFVVYFGTLTKTKELRLMTVPALLAYIPPRARKIFTRTAGDPNAFYQIVGVDSITEDGQINYADGGVGQLFLVVGSASHLLFDEDRIGILDRVDAFYRKVDPEAVEWIWITNKEPQRIHHQVAALEERNRALDVRDPDMIALLREQYDVLTEHVGQRFTSIHQYLLLRATSEDALTRGRKNLAAEVGGSSLMLKEVTPLDRDEAVSVLRVFYQGIPRGPGRLRRPGSSNA